jgi:hypothetical protein
VIDDACEVFAVVLPAREIDSSVVGTYTGSK